ncbi:nitroreductase [Paracoccus kondratievae]|uniref:nitroreductase n=1 Tax=Paracoccus kondratievae TaxID=135740 RepID=UPI00126650EB|nr:nitroreductase [Paracoccus kondratievae]QFQ89272.1 nitroreductase [Paracoccus kondratievae]
MVQDFGSLMRRRRSIRAYLDKPVPRAEIEEICRLARTAPSGANLQPGRFHVLTGTPLRNLISGIDAAIGAGVTEATEYSWFPEPMPPELRERQRAAGYALYQALGIARRDLEGRRQQFRRNYAFFGAPVGVVVTIDRRMGAGCFMDLGMCLMGFLLAAEARGLGATGIGALANYGPTVHQLLDLAAEEMVVCGIALGFPDHEAPENQVRTAREDLPAYTSFRGFPDS